MLNQSRLISSQTVPAFVNATSLWLISILQRARQDNSDASSSLSVNSGRKILMIRNSSFVERFVDCENLHTHCSHFWDCWMNDAHYRLFGNVGKHQRFFSKLVIHLIAVYCAEMQNGTLYPEAKACLNFHLTLQRNLPNCWNIVFMPPGTHYRWTLSFIGHHRSSFENDGKCGY